MVGRAGELDRLEGLLAAARAGDAGALAIAGEPGIGKTRLLDAVAVRADGFVRLRTRGVESEAALGYAGLLELLTPVRERLAVVPSAQARALAGALGWGPITPLGDRFLIAAGTLSLIAAAAEEAPVLLVVDDLQWVDAESAAAVLFAARRMHHDRAAFVLATRPGAPPGLLDGVDVLTLAGLSRADARRLLDGAAAAAVVERLVAQVSGNPLALLEIAARLTPAQRSGAEPLPDALPVGRHLRAIYEPLLAGLSTGARSAALTLAAAEHGDADLVVAALRQDGVDADAALDEAELAGVVVRDGATLRFRHPLLRSTAWRVATPHQRRRAHRALAAAIRGDDPLARTWHLAQATAGADDVLADDLVAVAERARTRQGFAVSSKVLQRAAAMTTDAADAATWSVAAVRDAFMSGDFERTRALARTILARDVDRAARGGVLHVLGVLEQYAGSVPAATDLLREAADLTEGRARVWSLAELAMTQYRLNDLAGMGATAARLYGIVDGTDPEQQVLADHLGGIARIVDGDAAAGRRLVGRAAGLMDSDPVLRDDPRFLCHALLSAGWLGTVRAALPRAERRLQVARDRGALGVLATALTLTAYGRAQVGDHAGAFADAGEAAELAEQLGYVADGAPAAEMLAWQSSARGLHDDARRHLERAAGLVARAGTTDAAAHLAITAAFCALCRGHPHETIRLLEARIDTDGGRGAMGEPMGVAPLLVEAYAASGRDADAATVTARYVAASTAPLPATAALVARCRALTAGGDDAAVEAFEQALAAHEQASDAFEAARTRLLYGAWLRRSGRRSAARAHLGAARDAFAGWDLAHWAARADAELRATGATARARHRPPREPLTSQETRVAMLVARGRTNKEVAAALFLSPKTVEHHLSSVYRKRGWRSRAELAHAYGTADDDAADGSPSGRT